MARCTAKQGSIQCVEHDDNHRNAMDGEGTRMHGGWTKDDVWVEWKTNKVVPRPHICTGPPEDPYRVQCVCLRGQDHTEADFDVPVSA
jgi:hypothetical protein